MEREQDSQPLLLLHAAIPGIHTAAGHSS